MEDNVIPLRPVDRKRLDHLQERTENPLTSDAIGYVHTILAQCFLPYKDPKVNRWKRKNGKYSIILTAGSSTTRPKAATSFPWACPSAPNPACFNPTSARRRSSNSPVSSLSSGR